MTETEKPEQASPGDKECDGPDGMPDGMVLSYLTLRRVLGVLGLALPVILLVGGALDECCVRPALSSYYHSDNPVLHGLFVGTLFAIGAFLICYKGYPRKKGEFLGDNWIANAAGIGAIGIAVFPTNENDSQCDSFIGSCANGCKINCVDAVYGFLHNAFSLLFLVAIALMALLLFTKSDKKCKTDEKKIRNVVYVACAIIIGVMTTLIIIESRIPETLPGNWTFLFETIAVFAFGTAWIVKGETLWADRCPPSK